MASYIRPADPILWSSSTTYDELTLVVDSSGNGYVSKQEAPSGTALTNTAYWVPIPNLASAVATAQSAAAAAQQAATAAQTAANQAQGTADTANSAAASAASSAQQAITAAGTAQTAAETAQSTANLSQEAALAAQIMVELTHGIYPIA